MIVIQYSIATNNWDNIIAPTKAGMSNSKYHQVGQIYGIVFYAGRTQTFNELLIMYIKIPI